MTTLACSGFDKFVPLLSNSFEARPALSLSTDFQIQRKQIWETFIEDVVIVLEPRVFSGRKLLSEQTGSRQCVPVHLS
jgi:hypothetical protein